MSRLVGVLIGAALVVTGCGDDGESSPATTAARVRLGEPLAVGETYEDPTGAVTMTLHGVRITGGLLLADAEACIAEDGPAGAPIQPQAWQLRVRGREQALAPTFLGDPQRAARPAWPDTVQLDPGECVRGKVAFELPAGIRPRELVFAQLATPVVWSISS